MQMQPPRALNSIPEQPSIKERRRERREEKTTVAIATTATTTATVIIVNNISSIVSVEYGLCEMMNKKAIRLDVAPKDGNWGLGISESEAMLPAEAVDTNVERMYKELPKWEEPFLQARARYQQIFKDLANKYIAENLLLVTHGEGVDVALSSLKKDCNIIMQPKGKKSSQKVKEKREKSRNLPPAKTSLVSCLAFTTSYTLLQPNPHSVLSLSATSHTKLCCRSS
ncbi:hypothetical protein RIF29_29887 [Crotalaria pallida]|uniref:Uncharacterized protein n=1 Tax=Crotalaria pallida TaxID=3830 RepID=A0AAN9EKI0_CROPI